jgi:hypothetical protein
MSKCEALVATPQLRWVRRAFNHEVLEQYWSDPLGVSGKGEWRDVPKVSDFKVYPLNESPVVHCDGD